MRYFKVGDNVLANCGKREAPNWQAGKIVSAEHPSSFIVRPYEVKFYKIIDGKDTWYFSASWLIKDTPTNRQRKGIRKQEAAH